jgi:succinyl-diaminopimelate desuccinylase
MLKGESSIFSEVFSQMTVDFNASASHPVTMETSTAAPPDIRLPGNESFSIVADAYMRVMGEPTPARAIGGGTDAKGHNTLIAAGALFTDELGPPINFHGINEGAPVEDLKNGARIIYRLFVDQIEGR